MFDPTRPSLRSRLARKAPLGAFWMSLGSATVVEIALAGDGNWIRRVATKAPTPPLSSLSGRTGFQPVSGVRWDKAKACPTNG